MAAVRRYSAIPVRIETVLVRSRVLSAVRQLIKHTRPLNLLDSFWHPDAMYKPDAIRVRHDAETLPLSNCQLQPQEYHR